MKSILIILFSLIGISGFSQSDSTKSESQKKLQEFLKKQQPKHDTTYVLELDAVFWQKLNYVVSKSNAEHLVWTEVNEYLNTNDPKKSHVKVVVDSVLKK